MQAANVDEVLHRLNTDRAHLGRLKGMQFSFTAYKHGRGTERIERTVQEASIVDEVLRLTFTPHQMHDTVVDHISWSKEHQWHADAMEGDDGPLLGIFDLIVTTGTPTTRAPRSP